jgi:hypothetical protein
LAIEFDDQALKIIGNNVKALQFLDNDRTLQAEIYLDGFNRLNVGSFQLAGGTEGSTSSDLTSVSFLTLGATAALAQERILSIGAGLTGTDEGAGAAYAVSLTVPATLSASSANSAAGSHTHAIDATIARSAITITGAGALAGGGTLADNRTITLNTPGDLSVASVSNVGTNHTHAIASSANPGAAAAILASNSDGYLRLVRLGLGKAPTLPLDVEGNAAVSGNLGVGIQTAAARLHVLADTEQVRIGYDASNYASLETSSGGNLTLAPTGDLVFAPAGKDVLPATAYSLNIGALNKKYLSLHAAELWVETLVAQETLATIGGRILVGPTNTLTADINASQSVLEFKYNNLAYNDTIYFESGGALEFMLVQGLVVAVVSAAFGIYGVSGDQTALFIGATHFTIENNVNHNGTYTIYSVAYNAGTDQTQITVVEAVSALSASGARATRATIPTGSRYLQISRDRDGLGGNEWYAGSACLNTGKTGAGFIDLYSLRGVKSASQAGPTIVGNVRNSTAYNDWTEHWAIGNLNGLYGYGTDTYGIAAGKFATDHAWIAADATNGFRIMHGTIQVARWFAGASGEFAAGDILIGRVAVSQNNVVIKSGGISLRNNATERIGLSAAGVLTIKDSDGAAVFTFNASTGAEFTKPLTIGTAGGVFQGTGTFASPTTGLKIWNDGGIGRIGGYNSDNLLWHADTNGTINLQSSASGGPDSLRALRMLDTGGTMIAALGAFRSGNSNSVLLSTNESLTSDDSAIDIAANSGSSNDAAINMTAKRGSSQILAQLLNPFNGVAGLHCNSNVLASAFFTGEYTSGFAANPAEYTLTLGAAAAPTTPGSGRMRVYFRSNKMVFQFQDGGTTRYKYLDLTGTGVTWVHTTAAP